MNHVTFYKINAWIEQHKHQEPRRFELDLAPLDIPATNNDKVQRFKRPRED